MSDLRPTVVIVGASFSGITALSHLYLHARVILIDPKDYFEYSPGILVCMTGKRLDRMVTSLKSFIEPYGTFIQGYFTSIEPNVKLVYVQTHTGEIKSVKYDALLLCCGVPYSIPIRSSTPTIDKRKAELLSFSSVVERHKSIAIIGGGLIGVELAAEFCHHLPSTKLIIFTSEDRLLPTLHATAGNLAQKWLSKKEVDIIFRAKIESIRKNDNSFELQTTLGDSYSVDYVINCTGIPSLVSDQYISPAVENIIESDQTKSKLRSRRGTILVNSSLQPIDGSLAGAKGVFACGDLVDLREETFSTNILPGWARKLGEGIKSGFVAEIQAEIASHNILRYLRSSVSTKHCGYLEYPKSKFLTPTAPLIACVTLGPTNAILIFNNIVLGGHGILGYLCSRMKLFIEISKIAELQHHFWARTMWKIAGYIVTFCHLLWTACICLSHQGRNVMYK